jgi:hypothetical protein
MQLYLLEKRGRDMKKNINKIPESVVKKLKSLSGRDIVVACARQFSADSIRKGALNHLQIELKEDSLHYPERILPSPSQGKYSTRNIEGQVIVRRDLPLETEYHLAESPNWGDSYYGTHTVSLPHKAYPKEFRPPRELEIILHCPDASATRTSFVIAARVDETLSQTTADFYSRLFENLNLLQENIGACGAESANTSVEEYARTLLLAWEILPPGSRDEAIARLFRGKVPSQQQRDTAESRYDFFESLDAKNIIVGSSGFRRYFGALIERDLVVFENIQYGNAIYIMYDNWEILSQQNRLDLISGRIGKQFDRVIHRDGWQDEVRTRVDKKRQDRKKR